MTANEAAAAILADLADTAAAREALYKDLHRHPELSMEEHRTSGIAHSCGHDVHVTALPGEEAGAGARDMVNAGIVDKLPKPDVALAQHVLGTVPGGAVGTRRGPVLTTASSIEITVHGAGTHGSMPNLGVDPIVLGAAIVGRLQTIVSREVAPTDTAVVTVGSFHGGTKSNIIPDAFRTPYCYWGLGGFADMDSAPGNHSPKFAPDIQPTLDRGAQAIIVAACAWLAAD
ncbi:M20/M25/M40 family metallo-hydrolase [Corynebacterium xerosis]|uniref:M20/M25/M40 family metallo-hydrolase n=1 Tax=Corynebacterium xerosis TaxID=1725 RepID=UPI00365DEC9D